MVLNHEYLLQTDSLDPFNHGTTTIRFQERAPPFFQELNSKLQKGWDIKPRTIQQISGQAEINSNNFRVQNEEGQLFLLKIKQPDTYQAQILANETITHLTSLGILCPSLRKTIDGKTILIDDNDQVCSVFDFISGNHFDGSKNELLQVAEHTASLHLGLATHPFSLYMMERGQKDLPHHNKEELLLLIHKIRLKHPQDEFEQYVHTVIESIRGESETIPTDSLNTLPQQVVHNDLHPHNVLFNAYGDFLSFIDFDAIGYAQKIKDIAFAMHRMARTFGKRTEKQNDIGGNLMTRARLFIEKYHVMFPLTDSEIHHIPSILKDTALSKIFFILKNHYEHQNTVWDFDLKKQYVLLMEAKAFELLFS